MTRMDSKRNTLPSVTIRVIRGQTSSPSTSPLQGRNLLLPLREAEDRLAGFHVARIHGVAGEKAEVFAVIPQQRDFACETAVDHSRLVQLCLHRSQHLVLPDFLTHTRKGMVSQRYHCRGDGKRDEHLVEPGKKPLRRSVLKV